MRGAILTRVHRIDLRSDTVTRPGPAMREAMASAEVGDDVYGEDPTVVRLQELAAARLGKEAALFVPSGTMANQIALRAQTQPGDAAIAGENAHILLYEAGAGAAISGVQFVAVGRGGLFGPSDVERAIFPPDAHFPRTRIVCLENTHNRSGGRVFPFDDALAIAGVARQHGLALHLDGARLFNAEVASGISAATWAAPFDSVSFCLSKGLGAPVGSLLTGPRELIARAHRVRKMLGGGMRQAGILAAAGIYALERHVQRLGQDHAHARRLAERLKGAAGLELLAEPETNMVLFRVPDGPGLIRRAAQQGVLVGAAGPNDIRAVTHLDVGQAEVDAAAEILRRVL
jgi:threonine aldolase